MGAARRSRQSGCMHSGRAREEWRHRDQESTHAIRFALARLRGQAPQALQEDVDVIAMESERLDRHARSFRRVWTAAEGPPSEVDMGELVRYTGGAAYRRGLLSISR